jgi:uncharacterized protein YndB with AHSA1/START domain
VPGSNAKVSSALTVTAPSEREIVMTRVFEAPRQLVFEAITKPGHVVHWYGPRGRTLLTCQIDFRVGGAWRFIPRGPDGRNTRMKGAYKEITPPEGLVSTKSFDDYASELLNTLTLTEESGNTTLTPTT